MTYFIIVALLGLVSLITSLFTNKWSQLVAKASAFGAVLGGLYISYNLLLAMQYILALLMGRIV